MLYDAIARALERFVTFEQPELSAGSQRAPGDRERGGQRCAACGETVQHDQVEGSAGVFDVTLRKRVAVRREQDAAGELLAFRIRPRRLRSATRVSDGGTRANTASRGFEQLEVIDAD